MKNRYGSIEYCYELEGDDVEEQFENLPKGTQCRCKKLGWEASIMPRIFVDEKEYKNVVAINGLCGYIIFLDEKDDFKQKKIYGRIQTVQSICGMQTDHMVEDYVTNNEAYIKLDTLFNSK